MGDLYILVGKEPVECDEPIQWGKAMAKTDRHVMDETIGESRVSTVFLGINHAYMGGKPLLFETMVFGGKLAEEMERCSTWDEAEAMHKRMVERVKLSI
jgi:hypothetical protein